MTKLNATYKKLKAELELLKDLADLQSHHYISSRKLLHEGLSKVYLWWKEANAHDSLLEKLYYEYNIQFKRNTIHDIQFTPLLRYLWNMHATINSNTLDQWNRALNNIHIAVQNDKEYYKTNAEQKIITYIANSGGITALAGYISNDNTEVEIKKNKLPKSVELKLRDAHLDNGKKFFATKAKPIANIITKQIYPSNNGFTLALVRKAENGYEVLGTLDDKEIVEQAVISAYKRNTDEMSATAKTIVEIIRTQIIPTRIANLAKDLEDYSNLKVEPNSKEYMKQLKRLLYIAKENRFVLSSNRAKCSVVTIAKPFNAILKSNKDVALAVNDRTFIENNLIHTKDYNLYTAKDSDDIVETKDEVAAFKFKLQNSVTKHFRFLRFYDLDTYKFEPSKSQSYIQKDFTFKPNYTAKLSASWINNMYGLFLTRWIDGLGKKIKRDEYKLINIAFNKSFIAFKYNHKANDFKETELIDLSKHDSAKGNAELSFLSKDIVPIFNALANIDIKENINFSVTDKLLKIEFITDVAEYCIYVPSCDKKGKRIDSNFIAYGA